MDRPVVGGQRKPISFLRQNPSFWASQCQSPDPQNRSSQCRRGVSHIKLKTAILLITHGFLLFLIQHISTKENLPEQKFLMSFLTEMNEITQECGKSMKCGHCHHDAVVIWHPLLTCWFESWLLCCWSSFLLTCLGRQHRKSKHVGPWTQPGWNFWLLASA